MVHIRDDGVFDAPLEKIWRYMNAGEQDHQHRSSRITKVLEQKGNTMVLEAEVRNATGSGTHKETWKFIMNPPKSWDTEYLSGPMKGTKHTHTYTSIGDKTKVEVAGDFRVEGFDEAATRKAILAYLEEVFNEDNAALKRFK